MYNYVVIDSLAENGYREVFGYSGRFDLGDAWELIASIGGYSW
jgi:hypothetical protein